MTIEERLAEAHRRIDMMARLEKANLARIAKLQAENAELRELVQHLRDEREFGRSHRHVDGIPSEDE
jgi:hypothetical protein